MKSRQPVSRNPKEPGATTTPTKTSNSQKRRRDDESAGGDGGDAAAPANKKRKRVVNADNATASFYPFPRLSDTALRIDVIRLVHKRSRASRIRLPFNRQHHSQSPSSSSTASPSKATAPTTNNKTTTTKTTTGTCRITLSMREGGRVVDCHAHRCKIDTSPDPYSTHPLSVIKLDEVYTVKWATLAGYQDWPPSADAGGIYQITIEVESDSSGEPSDSGDSNNNSGVWPPLEAKDLVGDKTTSNGAGTIEQPPCSTTQQVGEDGVALPPITPTPFGCSHWRLESSFVGFTRPLASPLVLKHASGKGDRIEETDYEARVMGGVA